MEDRVELKTLVPTLPADLCTITMEVPREGSPAGDRLSAGSADDSAVLSSRRADSCPRSITALQSPEAHPQASVVHDAGRRNERSTPFFQS